MGFNRLVSIDPATGEETTRQEFNGTAVNGPDAITAAGNLLNGFSAGGSQTGPGTAFAFDPASNTLSVLHQVPQGKTPCEDVTAPTLVGRPLYGITAACGRRDQGSRFSVDTKTDRFRTVYSLTGYAEGYTPEGLVTSGGAVYGITIFSLPPYAGTAFSLSAIAVIDPRHHRMTGGLGGRHCSPGLV